MESQPATWWSFPGVCHGELVLSARESRDLLDSVSRGLMGLSDLGSNGKKAFEEKNTIVTKTSLKMLDVVYIRNYNSLHKKRTK